jgi:bifunctional NMN adenylyltransferase/nudix hydrolase
MAIFKSDLAVFIGRMQPLHEGHLHVIREGLKQASNIAVLIGSSFAPRSYRNPFTFEERKFMLENSLTTSERCRVSIQPLEDCAYNDTQWMLNVQTAVNNALIDKNLSWTKERIFEQADIALIGHNKDSTSFYLNMFPQWGDSIDVPNYRKLNSTQLRNSYFSNIGHMWVADIDGHRPGDLPQDHIVSTAVKQFLEKFLTTPEYKAIRDEYEFILDYKVQWANAPYPPTFVTVDAVIIQSGHVLVIKRKEIPGKGQWALPGGFIKQDEYIIDGMIRELREETGIKVPDKVLKGSVLAKDVFDDPLRSSRGRTITHAFLIVLENMRTLPRVKGRDDAEKAKWLPISELRRQDFFEDHFDIINYMRAQIKEKQ